MAKINLLQWRAERRAAKQKEFYTSLVLAAAAGVVLALGIYFYYGQQIDGQNARNAFLQGEIKKEDAKITEIDDLDKQKSRLLARKKVIEELQANRSQMVHLFDSLVRTIPDGVTLTGIKQSGGEMTLDGRAQSNTRVAVYMRNLETSGWMAKPELQVIEAKPDTGKGTPVSRSLPYVFTLKVQLAQPEPGDDDGAKPAAGGTTTPSVPAASAATSAAAAAAATPAAVPSAPATQAAPIIAPAQPASATPQPRPAS